MLSPQLVLLGCPLGCVREGKGRNGSLWPRLTHLVLPSLFRTSLGCVGRVGWGKGVAACWLLTLPWIECSVYAISFIASVGISAIPCPCKGVIFKWPDLMCTTWSIFPLDCICLPHQFCLPLGFLLLWRFMVEIFTLFRQRLTWLLRKWARSHIIPVLSRVWGQQQKEGWASLLYSKQKEGVCGLRWAHWCTSQVQEIQWIGHPLSTGLPRKLWLLIHLNSAEEICSPPGLPL